MDHSCHECGEPQSVWMVARCTNPNKTVGCAESFCFKCLGQVYPQIYGSIFKGLWWLCPACMGTCKCETCSDPVKKAEYQRQSNKRKLKQRPKPQPIEDTKPLKLRSGTIHHKTTSRVPEMPSALLEDPTDGWICSRCSIVNSLDDIECIACCCHRKRNTRKRSQEPLHEVDKFQTYKETRKETRATENNSDDKATPVKGRVSALRQLVKKPWSDGWDQGRKLALELVEEARQIGIKQGLSPSQIRQMPTKYQLANARSTHVRKWFDREPTLAKKFLRAADFVYSKSNGTFLKDHVRSIDDLPDLIRQVDAATLPERGDSDDEADLAVVVPSPVPSSPPPGDSSSPSLPDRMQVYFHQPQEGEPPASSSSPLPSPVLFNLPITDIGSINDLRARLHAALQRMGASTDEKELILRVETDRSKTAMDECTSLEDLSHCSLLHVHVA